MDTLDQTPGGKPAQDGALSDVAEEILDEVDIEEYAKAGKPVPRARRYIFKVGKESFTVTDPLITGRQILTMAGKTPPEKYILRQVLHGGELKLIELDETVDLRAPGIERFRAMPRTAQDGE